MLDQMKKGAGTLLSKLLLGLLVLSFAVWGVADQLNPGRTNVLATVGHEEISEQRYQVAFQNELARMSQQFGQRITAQQARAFGLEQRVLNRLIASAAIDNHARDLGLGLSDEYIAKTIRSDPNLQGPDGKFSRQAFSQILNQINMSEAGFVATQKREDIRQQLSNAIAGDVAVPAPLVDVMHRYQNETRVIKAFTLDPKVSGKVPAPDEKRLKAYYEENKKQFETPRFRKVVLVAVTAKDAMKLVKISDEKLKEEYQRTKANYDLPERRTIQQIAFKDKAAAQAAYAKLSKVKAKDFKAAAEKLGFHESDYNIGEKTKAEMIDKKIADAVFKLPEGKLSEPVEGTFSTVLLRVTKIVPGKPSTFESAKAQVREALARNLARKKLQELLDKIDEERGAGKTLQEISDLLKLNGLELDALDDKGRGSDGKPALPKRIPVRDQQKITAAIFAGGVGVENDIVELGDGGYAWFDINDEIPAKPKTYEQAKADVAAIVRDLDERKAIATAARKAVDEIKKGASIEDVAKKLNLKVVTTKPVKRQGRPKGLSQAALRRAFNLKVGDVASAQTDDGKSRVILVTQKITMPPPPTADEKKALEARLSQQLAGDAIGEYVAALIKRYGQSVNSAVFNRANGRGVGGAG